MGYKIESQKYECGCKKEMCTSYDDLYGVKINKSKNEKYSFCGEHNKNNLPSEKSPYSQVFVQK